MGGDDIDGGADGAPPAIVGGGEMDGGFDGAGETVVLWPPVVVGMRETEGGFDGAGDAVVFSARSRFPSLEDRPRSNSTAAAVFDDKDDLPSFPFWPWPANRVMGKRPLLLISSSSSTASSDDGHPCAQDPPGPPTHSHSRPRGIAAQRPRDELAFATTSPPLWVLYTQMAA